MSITKTLLGPGLAALFFVAGVTFAVISMRSNGANGNTLHIHRWLSCVLLLSTLQLLYQVTCRPRMKLAYSQYISMLWHTDLLGAYTSVCMSWFHFQKSEKLDSLLQQ
ncbi:hypothetical protein ABZP36_012607 [Zizania latifolia]